jgi:hypothetical protein
MIITLPRPGDPHAAWSQEEERELSVAVDQAMHYLERLKLEPEEAGNVTS